MARRIYLLGASALAFAIFGCGGAGDSGLFGKSGVSGAGSGGAASVHGAGASSTPPGSGGDTASAGDVGLGGEDAGGDSGGSNTGGTGNGQAGHSGSGGSTGHTEGGSAGHTEGGSAGHTEGGSAGHTEGGTGGTAGAGTAGSAASGGAGAGAGGDGGGDPTCSQLLAEATPELTAARVCNLAANAEQCTGTVQTVCNCEVPVESGDSLATKAYEATLKQIKAKHCSQVCPAIACLAVNHAQCSVSNFGTTDGTCVASFGLPTPAF